MKTLLTMPTAPLGYGCLLLLASAAHAQQIYAVQNLSTETGSLASSPDLNGDGIADWLAGTASINQQFQGRVQARSGADGSLIFERIGAPASYFGGALESLGDVDGDGVSDFVVGSPFDSTQAPNGGRVSVHSGVDGSTILEVGTPQLGDELGRAILALGDVNSDGVPDFAATALREGGIFLEGSIVRAYSGANGDLLYALEGTTTSSEFGVALELVDDLNDDGMPEILVGDPLQLPERVHVFSTGDGSLVKIIESPSISDLTSFGSALARAGDQDGDGFEDFLVGASTAFSSGSQAGLALLISGATGAVLTEWSGLKAGDRFGADVASVADFDGDGLRELVVTAPSAFLGESSHTGYAQVLSSIDGSVLRMWFGQHWSRLGEGLAELDDIDGDGTNDMLVGSPNPVQGLNAGIVQLISTGYFSGERYCFADGLLPCPCGNLDPEAGCANGNGWGAQLYAYGSTSLSQNDMRFVVTRIPGFTTIIAMGTTTQQLPFGNGVLCVGGTLQRFPPVLGSDVAHYGPGLPTTVQFPGLGTNVFQAWYRDLGGPCGQPSNLSNAVSITWRP